MGLTFLARIRRATLGRNATAAARISSVVRESGRAPAGYLQPEPGPFDEPPPEPIALDPETLPCELRDDPPSS